MKSYTDLEQSKKLAEILPLESADMSYVEKGNAKISWYDAENIRITTPYEKKYYIPCWSLAALIELMPPIDRLKPMIDVEGTSIYYFGHCELCTEGDTLIDACVDMIFKLKEMNYDYGK